MPWPRALAVLPHGGGQAWSLAAGTAAILAAGSAGAIAIHGGSAPPPHRGAVAVRHDAPATPSPAAPDPTPPPVVPASLPLTVATPAPAAPPAPATAPRPRAAAPRPASRAAATSHTNWLTSDDGTLDTGVGTYGDCSGASSVPQGVAEIVTCITGRLYFVGHNYGVFTPLMHMEAGSGITYWDNRSQPHHYRVIAVRPSWDAANGVPPPVAANVTAQFQTCATPDGSIDRILDAVSDPPDPAPPAVAPPPVSVPAPVSTTVSGATTTGGATAGSLAGSLLSLLLGGHR